MVYFRKSISEALKGWGHMNIEPTTTPVEHEPDPVPVPSEPVQVSEPSMPAALTPDLSHHFFSQEHAETPTVVSSTPPVSAGEPVEVGNLGLYLVRMFAGLSVLSATSYLVWTLLNYFLAEPSEFIFFDLDTINLYVLIFGALFGAVYVIASMRLDRAQKGMSAFTRPHHVVSALWQSILVVWAITALASLIYAPISAATAGDASGMSITIEVVSSLYVLGMTALLFWQDKRLVKAQPNLVPTAILGVVLAGILVTVSITSLNPKQVKNTDSYDYNSSMFDSSSDATTDSSSEFDYDTYNTGTDATSN